MNPHRILNIDRNASKRDIISAAAKAMRDRKFSGREIAEAQKALLDPVSMAVHGFLEFIDVHPLQEQPRAVRPARPEKTGLTDLERLTIFDENP